MNLSTTRWVVKSGRTRGVGEQLSRRFAEYDEARRFAEACARSVRIVAIVRGKPQRFVNGEALP